MKTEETKKTTKKPIWKINKRFKQLIFKQVEKISRNLLNKAQKSVYEKDKVFYKLYNEIENWDTVFDEEDEKIPFRTPFSKKRTLIDRRHFTVSKHHLSYFMQIQQILNSYPSLLLILITVYFVSIFSRQKFILIQ